MTRSVVLIGAVLAASSGGALAADVAAGEQSFKKCLVCHSIGPDAKNKVGPAQNGLDGRKAGTVEGFSYSDANKNSGITWNEQTFKQYIKAPQAMIPGTKMTFAGITDPQEADNLWAYLKQFGRDGHIK
jgi:cytochrome c